MGLQSQLCESGEDALAVFQQTMDSSTGVSRFVCCLMDIRMPPGMSGHECTRLMREWEKQKAAERAAAAGAGADATAALSDSHPRLPIFALTANVLAMQVGFDFYLEKPLNAALLKQQLTRFNIATLDVKSRASAAPKK